MQTDYKKTINRKKLIKLAILTIVVLVSIFLSFKLVKYILPFVLALMFSAVLKRPVEFLSTKLKLKRGLATFICTLFFFLILSSIMLLVIIALVNQISSLVSSLPRLINDISRPISSFISSLNSLSEHFPNMQDEISAGLAQISSTLISAVASFASSIGQYVVNTAISIPSAVIFLFITVLATYFYTKDRKHFKEYLSKQLPDVWIEWFYENRRRITGTLGKWLKAQSLILTITFTELLIGFSLIGVRYTLILSIIIALIDILPVLGTGTILIPWITISFLTGNSSLAIKLLILYVVETSIRQIIEPKLVGKGIGVHPLITLIAMYIGVHFFGVLGFLLGPIYIMIFKNVMHGILNGKRVTDYISLRAKTTNSK